MPPGIACGRQQDWTTHCVLQELSSDIFLCHGATACGAWGSWKSLYLATLTVPEQSHNTRPESLVIVVLTVQQSQFKVYY